MRHLRAIGLIGFILGFNLCALAQSIEFTKAEGYESKALNRSKLWGGHGGFKVHAEKGGSLTVPEKAWQKAILNYPVPELSNKYRVSMEFTFSRHEGVELDSNPNIIALDLLSESSVGSDRIGVSLQRLKFDSSRYRLVFFENTGRKKTYHNGNGTMENALGFMDGEAKSGNLKLEMIVSKGKGTEGWSVAAILKNLDNGKVVLTLQKNGFEVGKGFLKSENYTAVNSSDGAESSKIEQICIDRFSIGTAE